MGYVEMHTHILPGIDDGADTPKTALKMVWQSYQQGVDTIILTPHYHPGRGFTASTAMIKGKAARLREAAKNKISEDIRFYTGQEIYWDSNVVDKLNNGELLTMAESSYVLIEFSTGTPIGKVREAVNGLTVAGYLPIIAHIERYDSYVGRIDEVKELIHMGAYIQMNCESLVGGIFDSRAKFCKKLFEEQLVHFISSDSHDTKNRPPDIKNAVKILEKKQGWQWFQKVFFEHPKFLIKGIEIRR